MHPTEKNVLSLTEEHARVITLGHPDIRDIADLNTGLSMSIGVMLQEAETGQWSNPTVILEIVAPYLKAAYGLGFNRGEANVPAESDSPGSV